jgi:hypothetical protein
MTGHAPARDATRRALLRWLVHPGLIGTVVVSLVFEQVARDLHLSCHVSGRGRHRPGHGPDGTGPDGGRTGASAGTVSG